MAKKKNILELKDNSSEDEVINMINKNKKLSEILKNKKILKKIFVPNRLINLILSEND